MARIDIIREAADLLGTNPLADALGVSRRSIAYWQDPDSGRAVPDGVMKELLPLIDAHIERGRQLRRAIFAEVCGGMEKERSDGAR